MLLDFSRLEEINDSLKPMILTRENKKTKEITKNEYNTVNQRILAFRQLFPNGSIQTEVLMCENGACLVKATAYDEEGNILATGHAREEKESSYINKTSFVENCETSAVGRCLGIIGIGVTTAVATAEEMQNQQEAEEKAAKDSKEGMKSDLIELWVKAGGEQDEKFEDWFKNKTPEGFTVDEYKLMKAVLCKKINENAEKKKGATK